MSDSLRASVPVPVEYPSSDGQPMAETSVHRECIVDTIGTARGLFAERPDVYVSGDLFVYYEEGNPRASGGAGRVRGRRGGEGRVARGWLAGHVQAVGGAEGAGLRAGGDVAEHAAPGSGGQACVVRAAWCGGILFVRPAGRVPGSGAAGDAFARWWGTSVCRRSDCRTGGRGYGARCSVCTCAAGGRRCGCTIR